MYIKYQGAVCMHSHILFKACASSQCICVCVHGGKQGDACMHDEITGAFLSAAAASGALLHI